jgi:uncharacterized membrane protein
VGFDRPEAFWLGALALLLLRRRILDRPLPTALRILALAAALAVVAGPHATTTARGRDLVLVLDRSRSVPESARARVEEVVDAVARRAGEGDRVGVVVFGREAAVERAPAEAFRPTPLVKGVDPDGSDLAGAIETATALVPPDRPGTVLVLSDGESTGSDPTAAARAARRRGLRVDAAALRRPLSGDVAIDEVSVPTSVRVGEPFHVTAWIRSDEDRTVPLRIRRDGVLVAEGQKALRKGRNRIRVPDRVDAEGVHGYRVEVGTTADPVPENDRANAAVRAAGRFRVLCVTPEGREDRLTEALRAAGIAIEVAAPARAPLRLATLDGYRAVVLEDVPLEDLPSGASAVLASWVRDLGGGLLVTGGRASFGPGGYHRSAVGETLPVSMEIREEQRRFHLALALVLDRSGSMTMPAGGGRTKMDLANLGAAAAVELLGPGDAVAVVAVDSASHVVVPTTPVERKGEIVERIRSIESMGGGIFVAVGLRAGAAELAKATQGTRHLVLFADAADAEEPEDYETFVPALVRAGVTVSVIGLGNDSDVDAALLREIAALGRGRMFFTQEAVDLPRLFAQDTIHVARSSVSEEPTSVEVTPEALALGSLPLAFPDVGGYSIAWLRPRAQAALRTRDETRAPLLSFWHHGLGRTAAYLGIVDGRLSGGFATWDGRAEFLSTVVRWVAGQEAADVHAVVSRDGHEGVVSVEVEPDAEALLAGLRAHVVGPDGEVSEVPLRRVDETRLEGRVRLGAEGIHHAVVRTDDGRSLRAGPLVLPYSPEHEPRLDPRSGERTLEAVAREGGGRLDPAFASLWEGPAGGRRTQDLTPHLAAAALLLLLGEIAVRRLHVRPRIPDALARRIRAWRERPRRVRAPSQAAPSRDLSPAPGTPPPEVPPSGTAPDDAPAPPPPPPPPSGGIADVLDRAKRRR